MAQVTLTINAESIQELVNQLRDMALPTGMKIHVQQVTTPTEAHVAPTTVAKLDKALDKALDEVERTEAAVEAKPKRGRPAKAVEPLEVVPGKPEGTERPNVVPSAKAPEAVPAPAPAPVTPAQVDAALFAEAKVALADYVGNNKECGREKAIALLKDLGVARLTELDTNGLQKFLAIVKG